MGPVNRYVFLAAVMGLLLVPRVGIGVAWAKDPSALPHDPVAHLDSLTTPMPVVAKISIHRTTEKEPLPEGAHLRTTTVDRPWLASPVYPVRSVNQKVIGPDGRVVLKTRVTLIRAFGRIHGRATVSGGGEPEQRFSFEDPGWSDKANVGWQPANEAASEAVARHRAAVSPAVARGKTAESTPFEELATQIVNLSGDERARLLNAYDAKGTLRYWAGVYPSPSRLSSAAAAVNDFPPTDRLVLLARVRQKLAAEKR